MLGLQFLGCCFIVVFRTVSPIFGQFGASAARAPRKLGALVRGDRATHEMSQPEVAALARIRVERGGRGSHSSSLERLASAATSAPEGAHVARHSVSHHECGDILARGGASRCASQATAASVLLWDLQLVPGASE